MKALSKMTIYEKAICLFKLLPEDMAEFIETTRQLAAKIAAGKITVQRRKNGREKIDDWPAAARKVCEVIDSHQKEILGNATMFAHYLLGEGLEGFTVYSLEDYIAHPDKEQSNIYLASKLLFF